ncbi:MAG: plastocyanin/azurin family copper-binding protein [Nanoarchaeota archaeon]|nr:plastocyanin/azurin family copper-binding protein [Nanoarchaeota archaeon]
MVGKVTIAVLLLVAIVGAVYLFSSFLENPITTGSLVNNPGEGNVIEITSSGFTPGTLTINKGDTVTWINMDTEPHWPASAFHPYHTVYPGSDIKKCGTAEESTIFDACQNLAPGESYSFTFNEVGSWGFHDHLNANSFGKIIVVE